MQFLKQHPILILFVTLVAVVLGLFVNTYLKNQNSDSGRAWGGGTLVVVTTTVKVDTLVDQVEAIGTARANESVSLTSKVTDTVSKVNFEDGQYAQKGDILVELTNSEETAQLAEAQAVVDESTRQFERMQNLISQKLASETTLDIERARMKSAIARLEAIVARLDARLIRAPFSGILGFRAVSPGSLLSPNTIVTTLDDVRVIKLDFSVPENFLSVIKIGQEVIASSPAYESQLFIGTVKTISSRVDPVTRSITIRAHLDNNEGLLRPGMLLTVNLVRSRSKALVIPEEALLPIGDQQYVYVVTEGIANRTKVKIGRRRPGIAEVIDGLEEGQEIIIQGIIKVRQGSKVSTRDKKES